MRPQIKLILLAILLFLAFDVLVAFRAAWLERRVLWFDHEFSDKVMVQAERDQQLAAAQQASSVWQASAGSQAAYARLLRERGNDAMLLSERIELYCQALAAYARALQRRPTDSQYLLNWADIRQLLGQVDCERPGTSGDFKKTVARALLVHPTSGPVLFAGALLFSWAGERDLALKLFKQVLAFAVALNDEQERFIFGQISSGADLRAVIPARFPQAVEWSRRFQREKPRLFSEWQSDFAQLQLGALALAVQEFEAAQVPEELHFERLQTLLLCAANSAVRQRVDLELALLLRRTQRSRLAEYFEQRSQLEDVAVLRAVLEADTRPLRRSLAQWGRSPWVRLDYFYTTVGFYLPEGRLARLIEINAGRGGGTEIGRDLQLLGSNDNRLWIPIKTEMRVETLQVAGRTLIAIEPSSERFKYWKIHFASPRRDGLFADELDRLLRVYG